MAETIPVLLITGPPGVGKTSVAIEISELLDHARVAHALVDLDSLRWCYPRPAHDPFRVELALKNLAAVWSNFQAAGATRLILADVLEAREELEGFRIAIPNGTFFVVRLQASVVTLAERLRGREIGSGLERMLSRTVELAGQMEESRVEDLLVNTEGKSVTAVAREVLARSGWMTFPDVGLL